MTPFDVDRPVKNGNVCVSDSGYLFVALHQLSRDNPIEWEGIGFNGKYIRANCAFVSNNLNEFLQQTYGESFSSVLAEGKT